ncbi:MAG: hypothetical protein COV66_07695 [Nitrospinae bacterium CG11_big_fil_rev_8_21_14_0_20_45_15]|nr:MAG: hypothetical protein COV66_07695 [Nitrospinae bacterium CG11_big_fil_rev_8_21_14_0_20_45_15]
MNGQEKIQIEGEILDIELKTTMRGDQAAIIKFLTKEKEIEVMAWPEYWEFFQSELQIGRTLVLEGILNDGESEYFTLDKVISSD